MKRKSIADIKPSQHNQYVKKETGNENQVINSKFWNEKLAAKMLHCKNHEMFSLFCRKLLL